MSVVDNILWYSGGIDWVRRPPDEYDRAVEWVIGEIATLAGKSGEEVKEFARKSIFTLDCLLEFAKMHGCLPMAIPQCDEVN